MFVNATQKLKQGYIQKNPCESYGYSYCKNCTYNSICGFKEAEPFRKNKKSVKKQSFKRDLGE